MMELMRNWMISLITVVIISSFVEMLMPSGSFKKYSKLVVGLIIMLIIVQPILMLTDNDQLFSKYAFEASNQIDKMAIVGKSDMVKEKQMEQIVSTYNHNLNKQIQQSVRSLSGEHEAEVIVHTDSDLESSGFGSIRNIDVVLTSQSNNSTIAVVAPVNEISIGDEQLEVEEENKLTKEDETLRRKIIENLQTVYNVPEENIKVEIQKNNR